MIGHLDIAGIGRIRVRGDVPLGDKFLKKGLNFSFRVHSQIIFLEFLDSLSLNTFVTHP